MTKEIDAIEATLRRLQEKHGPKAEKILKRGKNGEPVIEYFKQGRDHHFENAKAELARTSQFVPALPLPQENGTECAPPCAGESTRVASPAAAEGEAAPAVASPEVAAARSPRADRAWSVFRSTRLPQWNGTWGRRHRRPCGRPEKSSDNPLADLIRRAQAQSLAVSRRGRRQSLDERGKGQLLGLLAVGLSLRQAAAVLGVSHTTLRRTLAASAELSDEINAARSRAALEPLACVIRESKRSWRAATWLLKYLDGKLKDRD